MHLLEHCTKYITQISIVASSEITEEHTEEVIRVEILAVKMLSLRSPSKLFF